MRTYGPTLMRLLFLAGLVWPAAAFAQNVQTLECSGTITGGQYADVTVHGGSCTLDGVDVFGSVIVNGGGHVTTQNNTWISGSIQVNGGGDITLGDTNVFGEVKLEQSGKLNVGSGSSVAGISVKASGDVTIGAGASVGEVLVENSGEVRVYGRVAAVSSKASGGITLTNATVFPGGVSIFNGTDVTICGSEIGTDEFGTDGSGGINSVESRAVLADADAAGCNASKIEGTVNVRKGTGDVTLVGAKLLAGDLIVIEQDGDVTVKQASLSDIKIENLKSNVVLDQVTTDSDTTINDTGGSVTITSSTLGSDVAISLNGTVTIEDSSFSLEDVLISGNGPVVIRKNCDMRLTISENGNVSLEDNADPNPSVPADGCVSGYGWSDADVHKNGYVTITGNTGEALFCSDNAGVMGSGNSISFIDGQCAEDPPGLNSP